MRRAALAATFAITLAATLFAAHAATPSVAQAEGDAASNDQYLVETQSPSGTKINLFDYWTGGTATTNDYFDEARSTSKRGEYYTDAQLYDQLSQGINKGHELKFTRGFSYRGGNYNSWANKIHNGMFASTLESGYPVLKAGRWDTVIAQDESLAYLFDLSEQEGKTAYENVGSLLQVIDGYYTYDSRQNYAEFDVATNAFKVYNTWAVYTSNSTRTGQFFPFNPATEVFKTNADGTLQAQGGKPVQAEIKSNGGQYYASGKQDLNSPIMGNMNHYFGMSMSTRFLQPEGGMTVYEGQDVPVTYHFSGDDDALLYIDNVLVGNLGGIHDAMSIDVDFSTGQVKIYLESNPNQVYANTTLRQLFEAAGCADQARWNGNTFADDTVHTLKLFYMERGNLDSNLSLKFNLVELPDSYVVKSDQTGEPVAGAAFELYATDGEAVTGMALASGVTDADGTLRLMVADGTPLNFDLLYKEYGYETYYLEETQVPAGYRSTMPGSNNRIYLRYIHNKSTEGDERGFVVDDSDSVWRNGAFAAGRELLLATGDVYYSAASGSVKTDEEVEGLYDGQGTLFAVVLVRDASSEGGLAGTWRALWGSSTQGYVVSEQEGLASVLEAAQNGGAHAFTVGQNGRLRVELGDLPGMLTDFYWLRDRLSDSESIDQGTPAKYAVATYHTTAGSVEGATADNTRQVYNDDFSRTFSMQLNISNIKNRLYMQKDDGHGTFLEGATFGLYTADQVTVGADGTATLNEGATPIDTATSVAHLSKPNMDGAAVFPSTDGGLLTEGTYYVKELEAPEGYRVNDALVKVVVDAYGVHADAGTEDDGVEVSVGVGQVVKSVAQFATNDHLDNTLGNIVAIPQLGELAQGDEGALVTNWANAYEGDEAAAAELHLVQDEDAPLEYKASRSESDPVGYTTKVGWPRVEIRQCVTDGKATAEANGANYTEIKGLGTDGDERAVITSLFSGTTIVRVSDKPVARLEVTKKLEVPEGVTAPEDLTFAFEFTLPTGDAAAGVSVGEQGTAADGTQVGEQGEGAAELSGAADGAQTGATGEGAGEPNAADGAQTGEAGAQGVTGAGASDGGASSAQAFVAQAADAPGVSNALQPRTYLARIFAPKADAATTDAADEQGADANAATAGKPNVAASAAEGEDVAGTQADAPASAAAGEVDLVQVDPTDYWLTSGDVLVIKPGQVVRIYGLKTGDAYVVRELSDEERATAQANGKIKNAASSTSEAKNGTNAQAEAAESVKADQIDEAR